MGSIEKIQRTAFRLAFEFPLVVRHYARHLSGRDDRDAKVHLEKSVQLEIDLRNLVAQVRAELPGTYETLRRSVLPADWHLLDDGPHFDEIITSTVLDLPFTNVQWRQTVTLLPMK